MIERDTNGQYDMARSRRAVKVILKSLGLSADSLPWIWRGSEMFGASGRRIATQRPEQNVTGSELLPAHPGNH